MNYEEFEQSRRKWCEVAASTFFDEKKKGLKYYLADVRHPLPPGDTWTKEYREIDDEMIEKYKTSLEEWRKEFLEYWPEKADDEDAWKDYIEDCCSADWDEWMLNEEDPEFGNGDDPNNPMVRWIDVEHPKRFYKLTILSFFNENSLGERDNRYVPLTDKEYIQLLVECLMEPGFSIATVYFKYPEVFREIAMSAFSSLQERAVFLTEIKEDAKSIMDEIGKLMPNPITWFEGKEKG